MNHTYEKTYKNARAVWVAHIVGFIAGIETSLDYHYHLISINSVSRKNHNRHYIVYYVYIDDVNKHKKKIDGQGNSIYFRICFSFNKICNLFIFIYKMFCIEKM